MTTVGSILLTSPSLAMGMIIVAAAGLLWSPVAAVITRHQARKHGLTGSHYAVAGALYSIFLLVPWFYLGPRVRGDKEMVPSGWTFALLYLSWVLGPIVSWWIVMETDYGSDSDATMIVLWVMLAAWAGSIMVLLGSGRPRTGQWRGVSSLPRPRRTVTALLPVRYILPFALAWASVVFVMGWILQNPQ